MAKMLIIDDKEQTRAFLRSILEGAGHEVVEASDGESGLNLFFRDPVQVVIADIELPDQSGLALIQELAYDFPETRIIALTDSVGTAAKTAEIYAKTFGAMYVFVKPVETHELLDAVNDLLVCD